MLRGDTAVLDREIGRVARGPHAVDTGHLAVSIDWDETAGRTRGHAGHRGTVKLGHRDDPIRLKVPRTRTDRDVTRLGNLAVGRGDRRDPVVLQQLPHGVARAAAEDRQRRVLGRRDRDRQLDVHVLSPRGCHQRKLVDRQRPSHPPRGDERQTTHITTLNVLNQPVQQLIQSRVVNRERMLKPRVQASAESEQNRIVGEPLPRLGMQHTPLRIKPLEAVNAKLHANVPRELLKRIAPSLREAKRLAHNHRPVHELRIGRNHRRRDARTTQLAQHQRRLEPRHPTAHNNHIERLS